MLVVRKGVGRIMKRGLEASALLWAYAASVAGFYALVARRTGSAGVRALPAAKEANAASSAALPRVTIVVPARDEERNIRACVESLLAQDYPNFAVIVVDDVSTDATPAILDDIRRNHPQGARLEVTRVERLPEGWAGKPHALHTGAVLANGDWLLFTDADTRHRPEALRFAVQLAVERGDDLFSLATTQKLPDFWGRVLMPLAFMGIAMQYPAGAVNDPASPVAIANGQYILIRAETYRRLGGYASPRLRATVLDDRDLAAEVKRAGGRLELVDGRELVETRMYHGLREHWDGWSKNAYAGSRGGPLFFLLMLLGLPMTGIVPFALLALGLLGRRPRLALAAALPVAALLAYRARVNRELGVPRRYALTHPLAAAVFEGILARSFWRKLSRRGVAWRGRTYQV